MQKISSQKNSLAHRARFMILKTDTHLAGLCAEIRHESGGRRSQAVLALAEQILLDGYSARPLNMQEISVLAKEGGISITTHLTTTSKRFPLVLHELEGCEGLKARSDCLKGIIERPHLAVFTQQLEPRAIAH